MGPCGCQPNTLGCWAKEHLAPTLSPWSDTSDPWRVKKCSEAAWESALSGWTLQPPEQLTDGAVMEPGGEAELNLAAVPSAYPSVPPGCPTGTRAAAGI